MNLNRHLISACIALYEERFDDVCKLLVEAKNDVIDETAEPLFEWLEIWSSPDSHVRIKQRELLTGTASAHSLYATLLEASRELALEKQSIEVQRNENGFIRTLHKIRNGRIF